MPTWITAGATVLYTLATVALVWVTIKNVRLVGRYTDLTKRLVEEAREARNAGVRPFLVPVLHELEGDDTLFRGTKLYWGVENIGLGPAREVDVTLTYGNLAQQLHRPMIRSGETRMVRDSEGYRARLDLRESKDHVVHLSGRCLDLYGNIHGVAEELPLGDRWRRVLPESLNAAAPDELQGGSS